MLLGGYGTKAGAAKNPWVQHIRKFAKAKGVRYHEAMKHHMDELRHTYHNGKPPSLKPRSTKPKKPKSSLKKPSSKPKKPKRVRFSTGTKPSKPRKTKKPKTSEIDDIDMALESASLPKPPTPPELPDAWLLAPPVLPRLPPRIKRESKRSVKAEEPAFPESLAFPEEEIPVVSTELTHAPEQLLLQGMDELPDLIKLETGVKSEDEDFPVHYAKSEPEEAEEYAEFSHRTRDVKPRNFKVKTESSTNQRRKDYLNTRRAKLPRVKNEPLLLEAPLPFVKQEVKEDFSDLPGLEPGLQFLRPNKRKAQSDIKAESKALVLSRDILAPSSKKKGKIDIGEPLTWSFIWNHLLNKKMRQEINRVFEHHQYGPQSTKRASLLGAEAATQLGYTRASARFNTARFKEWVRTANKLAGERGLKFDGSGYKGGNLWDDIKGAVNKVADFGKDVYEGVKKGAEIARGAIGIVKKIPVIGEAAGEVEKGLDLIGLGYGKKRKAKRMRRM